MIRPSAPGDKQRAGRVTCPRALLRTLQALFLLLATFMAGPLLAADRADASALTAEELQLRLASLKETIEQFTRQLEENKSERAEIERTLKGVETEIGTLHQRIATIVTDLAMRRSRLAELRREQQELVAAKQEQQQYIAQQVRAAYKVGRQEYLKILLNQENPSQVSRMLKYYDYFNRARAAQVERYNTTLASLRLVEEQIEEESLVLQEDQVKLQARQRELTGRRTERESTLAKLNATIQGRDAEIRKLTTDRDHLEELLERISRNIAELPVPLTAVPFADVRGDMLLPVVGGITDRFGSPNKGSVKWNGLFIAAEAGAPVHAIHYGRVVFSDWLRGFGLMIIINHGNGYMSLYGHNESILRETGEWVQAGEVIGSAGNSGGLDRTGLYFEIRVSGKPTDPLGWCVARARGTSE